jgi:4-amino-4-deoxy-L-arabinose transferase-like glycosyltransferase
MTTTNVTPHSPPGIKWLFGSVAIYFAIAAILRLFYAPSLGLDEAEMMIVTQELLPGYGSQPPLYGWLQSLVFAILGRSLFALALVNAALMLTTFVFYFLSGREIFADENKAWAAAMALFTVPTFFWGSQLSLTHTVLAAAIGAMTLYVMLRLAKTGTIRDYLALGLCFALGFVSKYNYLPFALALLLAACLLPDFRRRVVNIRFIATLALALLLLAPHFLWLASHWDTALSESGKLRLATDEGLVKSALSGITAISSALINYAVLPVVLFLALAYVPLISRFGSPSPRPGVTIDGWRDGRSFVLKAIVIGIGLIACAVLIMQVTRLQERWLHPVLFLTPLGLLILLERRFTPDRITILNIVSTTIAIGALVALVTKHTLPELGKRPQWRLAPFAAIADGLRETGFDNGYILAPSVFVGGNLKYRFPESTVSEPRYGLWPPAAGKDFKQMLLVWQGDGPPDARLIELWQQLCGTQVDPTDLDRQSFSGRFKNSRVRYQLSVAIVPMCESPALQ